MKWGLENTWSYYEERQGRPDYDRDGLPKARNDAIPGVCLRRRQERSCVPWLSCIDGIKQLWNRYQRKAPTPGIGANADAGRNQFREYIALEDPKCIGQLKKTAPRLYFDFTTDTTEQFVLERVEVRTLSFSEYKGGGFAEKEAWYDILLSHREGLRSYIPEPRLVFKEHGRVTLEALVGQLLSGLRLGRADGGIHHRYPFRFLHCGQDHDGEHRPVQDRRMIGT